jgi:hypothetical protein
MSTSKINKEQYKKDWQTMGNEELALKYNIHARTVTSWNRKFGLYRKDNLATMKQTKRGRKSTNSPSHKNSRSKYANQLPKTETVTKKKETLYQTKVVDRSNLHLHKIDSRTWIEVPKGATIKEMETLAQPVRQALNKYHQKKTA